MMHVDSTPIIASMRNINANAEKIYAEKTYADQIKNAK